MEYAKVVTVRSGSRHGHIQGIAYDPEQRMFYASFTTRLVKIDLQGNIVGSVVGLAGHLGCIAWNAQERRVYGSLEYKNDSIGKGILERIGGRAVSDGFYMVRFDVDQITGMELDAEKDGIMTAVYLKEVCEDYAAPGHRYGCSGIDGTTFAPLFGGEKNECDLYVSYGVYADVTRRDNDHQVILRYSVKDWDHYARPLDQKAMHCSGPEAPDGKYFVFTGNTTYGVQNLEYDRYTDTVLAAVYRGKKPEYPNWPMFVLDRACPPQRMALRGTDEKGECLKLAAVSKDEIPGVDFPYGSTGMIALGDGYYYFSEPFEDESGYCSTIRLYRLKKEPFGFERVE